MIEKTMPNRILREGILSSDAVNALSLGAEVFYRRLMSVVDDFGRFDGRVNILRASLYAVKLDKVSEKEIENWINECVNQNLLLMYVVDNKQFVEVVKFNQQKRTMKSKWPSPQRLHSGCAADAHQTHSNCTASAHLDGDERREARVADGDEGEDETPPSPKREKSKPATKHFNRFWEAWPKHFRKHDPKKCEAKWGRENLDAIADKVVAAVERCKASREWTKEGGQYIPAPLVWLNQSRWESAAFIDTQPTQTTAPKYDLNAVPDKPGWQSCAERLGLDTTNPTVVDLLKRAHVVLKSDKRTAPTMEDGQEIEACTTWPEKAAFAQRLADAGKCKPAYVEYVQLVGEAVRLSHG
jgi:hypothetical protein